MFCNVYRCVKQDEMYIYVHVERELNELPPELLKQIGSLEFVMKLQLSSERKLARADVESVMRSLTSQGFYLQMPPKGIQPELNFGD